MATAAPKLKPVPDQEPQEVEPKKKKSKILLLAILGAILIIGGGAAAWYFTSHSAEKASAKAKEVKPPLFIALDTFTVNLRGDSEEQFLQVAMTVQVMEQSDVDQLKLYMPEVRNRLLLLLSAKTGEQILTPEGKKQLSDEIIAALKKPFAPNTKPQAINNVFFTSFVVQ